MRRFVIQRWFLLALAVVLTVGIMGWRTLEPIANAGLLRNGIVATVLFLMAFPLQAGAMWIALRRPWAPMLGVAMNFGLLPLAAWGVSLGLRPDMAAGLLVAATTPCTLASAAVWTRRAGGNDAAAILVTILTNGTCFVVTPLWLAAMLGEQQAARADIDVLDMVRKLGLLVVLPMTVAQLLRLVEPLGRWATHHGRRLSLLAQCGILSMVFIGAITTGRTLAEQPSGEAFALLDWMAMIAAVLGVHLTMLGVGYFLAGGLGLAREDQIAVGIAGSQKTLMVGLQVAMDSGLLILPMVVYHVGQLIVDTVIADRWRKKTDEAIGDRPSAIGKK